MMGRPRHPIVPNSTGVSQVISIELLPRVNDYLFHQTQVESATGLSISPQFSWKVNYA